MRPDVSSLCVNPENGPEASVKGGQRWSVAGVQKIVVLQPVGQMLEVAHVPGNLPHLQSGANASGQNANSSASKRTFMTNSSACSAAL
jgi:hypothetical protein